MVGNFTGDGSATFVSEGASNNNFIFGFGLGFITRRVTEEAANESGAAIGFPPLPNLLNEGVVAFSGEANPRGRTFAFDLGDAR